MERIFSSPEMSSNLLHGERLGSKKDSGIVVAQNIPMVIRPVAVRNIDDNAIEE
jgi:hypothetical protein